MHHVCSNCFKIRTIYRFIPDRPPDSLANLEARYASLERGVSPDGRQLWLNWIVLPRATGKIVGYVQATVNLAAAHSNLMNLWKASQPK